MKAHPESVYRGERVENVHGAFVGVRVYADDNPLSLPHGWQIGTGFEWGYAGGGPAQLALAIVLHATGDRLRALAAYRWFMWLKVYCWGSTWRITAAEVLALVAEFERAPTEPDADGDEPHVRTDQAHAPPEANADDWLRRMFDERGGEP